jgi:hypothetical protein
LTLMAEWALMALLNRLTAFWFTGYLTGSEFIMNISSFKLSLIGLTGILVLLHLL